VRRNGDATNTTGATRTMCDIKFRYFDIILKSSGHARTFPAFTYGPCGAHADADNGRLSFH